MGGGVIRFKRKEGRRQGGRREDEGGGKVGEEWKV